MRLIRFVRRHPITVLGLFATAFIVWLWRDSLPTIQPSDPEVRVEGRPRRQLPLSPPIDENAKPDRRDTAEILSKLKPGMTRAEVEGLVGVPAPQDIHPVTVADGKVTYRTAYEADFGPAPTVRPIHTPRPQPVGRDPLPKGRTLVTLEFDATKPGHPLLSVHFPDPLF
jgi:hypothetical protein